MTIAVCPGSFDPVTLGHVDVVARGAELFEEVVVCVVVNPNKSGMFSVEERVQMLTEVTTGMPGVRVDSFSGLLVDYCREVGATALLKGLRATADYEYELPMANMNRALSGVDTVFLPTRPDLSFVSSSLCREVARLGGDVEEMLPAVAVRALRARLGGQSQG